MKRIRNFVGVVITFIGLLITSLGAGMIDEESKNILISLFHEEL